jgi:hypothetical protein
MGEHATASKLAQKFDDRNGCNHSGELAAAENKEWACAPVVAMFAPHSDRFDISRQPVT